MKLPRGRWKFALATILLSLGGCLVSPALAQTSALGADAVGTAHALAQVIEEQADMPISPMELGPSGLVFRTHSGDDQAFEIRAPGSTGMETVHGALRVPDFFPKERHSTLVQALNSVLPPLPWKSVGSEHEALEYRKRPHDAMALRGARLAALRLRRGEPPPDPVQVAREEHRYAFSHWLAEAMGESSASKAPPQWEQLRDALKAFPKHEPGIFGARESIRGAPKLWAFAALAARERGEHQRALALADVATRFALPDVDALRVWETITKDTVAVPPSAFPAIGLPEPPEGVSSLMYVCVALGLFLWLWIVRREGRRRLMGAIVVGLGGLAVFYIGSSPSTPSSESGVPELPANLQAPLAGGGCVADPMLWSVHGFTLFATCDGHEVTFEIREAGRGDVQVDAFGQTVGPTAQAARDHLRQEFRTALSSDWHFRSRPVDGPNQSRRAVSSSEMDRFELGLTAMLAYLAFWMLILLGPSAWNVIRGAWRADRRFRAWAVGIFALTLVAHLLLDSRLVMVYTGYDLTARLAGVDGMPRYGAGTMWIYQPAFGLIGVTHEAVQWTNRLLGILLTVPTLVLVLAIAPRARLEALVAAACVGLLPVALRDHTSEGIQTGTSFFLMSAVAALAVATRRGGSRWIAWTAVPGLLFVGTCRPEAILALPCIAIAMIVRAKRWQGCQALDLRSWFLFGAIAVCWLSPHIHWLFSVTESLVVAQDIAPVDGFAVERIARVWMQDNIFLSPWWVPWTIPLLALFAIRARVHRVTVVGYLVASLAWLAVTSVDLPDVSIPRVHVPALLILLPAAAVGLAQLRQRRIAHKGMVGLTLCWALVAAPSVLEATNGDAEEAAIQALKQDIEGRDGRACIGRIGLADSPPAGRTPRYFPEYLFPNHYLLPLEEVGQANVPCDHGTWVVLGTRCYMRDPDLPSSAGLPSVLEACARVRDSMNLQPIVEMHVPHRPQSTLPMYPDVQDLRLGVYRVLERDTRQSTVPGP